MTAKLVRNMTDSDLLDMHYFLTEDDDLDNDEFEEGFTSSNSIRLICVPALCGLFYSRFLRQEEFPIK